ncbi:biotin/lipoyl-binding protein [Ruminococcus sp. CLA-AA-H200]|uniref:Biotin/lipoyl-binding protein n=1 Tax=Ruminococcus turbiniformis TaxID=2881258 RepID=A0ABS8FWQ4_9FIRM|nr:biotin/lipoyl-containing protein [Ruminococcus turbiniformis]MCC2254487.1 biotin/lipoyl-binding protein [Ruminococcus turbiniformis]
MVKVFKLPRMGATMKEGTVAKYLVKEGDKVSEGDALYEVTTDKITNQAESDMDGYVRKLLVEEGTKVPCQTPVLIVSEEETEDISAYL